METPRKELTPEAEEVIEKIRIALERAIGGVMVARGLAEHHGADQLQSKFSELCTIINKHSDALGEGNTSGNIEPISDTVFDLSQKSNAISRRLSASGLSYFGHGLTKAAHEFTLMALSLEAIEKREVKL